MMLVQTDPSAQHGWVEVVQTGQTYVASGASSARWGQPSVLFFAIESDGPEMRGRLIFDRMSSLASEAMLQAEFQAWDALTEEAWQRMASELDI